MTSEPKNLLAPSRREARLTSSPSTVYWSFFSLPVRPTVTKPELMPMRMAGVSGKLDAAPFAAFSFFIISWHSSAARQARAR